MTLSLMEKLTAELSVKIGREQPALDGAVIGTVVRRSLELLAVAAEIDRLHPLTDPTVYLVAHALANPRFHDSLEGLRLDLPGLTCSIESFAAEADIYRSAMELYKRRRGD